MKENMYARNVGLRRCFMFTEELMQVKSLQFFSSAYKPAKSWSEVDDKVIVTMYCDKCWSTDTQIYDFEGNLLV